MCGIAGFAAKSSTHFNVSSVIEDMTAVLTHRGPNDGGTKVVFEKTPSEAIALGHRRLSIIDLSVEAHQPMLDTGGELTIVFNGEVYNYLELQSELKALGYSFVSKSDTEVVLCAYKAWGTECFKRFNGMWALAIFDARVKKLILSRDRFGKKPLYFYKDENSFVFASEIKSIFEYPNICKKPNFKKIYRYIAGSYRYVDADDDSFFDGICLVPKSSYMTVDENLQIKNNIFWNLEETKVAPISDSDAIENFREIFIDSVRLRLRSDVPVGCMLSGGMDSTSITCVAHKILKTPIATFSGITGEEKGVYDESEYIDEVVKETKAEHHYIRPDPLDLFETMDEMLRFHDEPICTVTWYSLYLISQKIKNENVPVVLNGHGGDEILAGYWDHYHYNFFDLESAGDLGSLDYEQKKWLENHNRAIREICQTREYIQKLRKYEVNETSKFGDYSYCFTKEFEVNYKNILSLGSSYDSALTQRLSKEIMFETVPASLKAEDRNTMASSIESRSPMLDYRLVEFCFSMPNHLKIRDGVGKWALREAMRGILPEKVRVRKDKAGFVSPAYRWFRGENREQIRELINSDATKNIGAFDITKLNEIFDEHLSGKQNHQMFLWQLINVALWYRIFFEGHR